MIALCVHRYSRLHGCHVARSRKVPSLEDTDGSEKGDDATRAIDRIGTSRRSPRLPVLSRQHGFFPEFWGFANRGPGDSGIMSSSPSAPASRSEPRYFLVGPSYFSEPAEKRPPCVGLCCCVTVPRFAKLLFFFFFDNYFKFLLMCPRVFF